MKFLFLTDFHGNHKAYKKAFKAASESKCDAVVLAGDIFPKSFPRGALFTQEQRAFWKTWLLPKLEKLKQEGIAAYVMYGNDDARGALDLLNKAHDLGIVTRLDGRGWINFGDYQIFGLPWVNDYPFQLKDWVCGDMRRMDICSSQFGPPLATDKAHFIPLRRDWDLEMNSRPCIKELLEELPEPRDRKKAIVFIHAPPNHGGLDVTARGDRVGSKAVLQHLIERNYLLSMHGHIHESPKTSNKWHSRIVDTLVVQPGAVPPCHVYVDLKERVVRHPTLGEVRW